MPYLVPMLENAGAVVVQPRERDTQTHEQVVDDSEAMRLLGEEVIGNGQWVIGEGEGWGADEDGMLLEGENPFSRGSYLSEKAGNTTKGEVKYIPTLPAGEYAVYVSYKTLSNSSNKCDISFLAL